MIPGRTSWTRCALLGLLLLPGLLAGAPAAEHLTWRKDKNSIDADITSWDLVKTLEHISEATGWQIYFEPGAKRDVSTKFKDRPADRALDLLLGDLGRVLLPGTNGGPPRLLVFRTHEKDATQLVRRERKPKPIPDELIVTMKAGKSVEDLAKKLGAKVVGKSKGLNSGRLKFDNEDAANAARDALRDNEDVASTDPNFPVSGTPVPEGTGAPAAPNLRLQPVREGEGLIIGLIDTAVQRQGGPLDGFLLQSISVAGEAALSPDRPSHGTSMFETLLRGISVFDEGSGASRVRILPVDVYGSNPSTTTYEVAEGIFRAMQQGAQIINLSLGSEGDTPYLYQVIRTGSESGRIFIGSAGNLPVTTPTFPAAYPEVIAVTAGDAPGRLAPYANRGNFVDVMAPGTSVVSYNGQAWRVNGTSPAAAYISGAIAGTADTRGGSLAQAAAAVRRSLPPPPP
ncbi:MAG TPA: S8 family serine peptidase [Verrucomicrobiae bacterium]|nr:S8 family serine peptidase [Verrucomicrobiae bacterium]